MNIRRVIMAHMRTMGHLLFQEGHLCEVENVRGIEDYITSTGIERWGVWGSDVELFAFSHLLQTSIYSFSVTNSTWQRYSPSLSIEDTMGVVPSEEAAVGLYIRHCPAHFQVIQSVS